MFSCEICEIFKNTFFLQSTSSGSFCILDWLKRCSENFLCWFYLENRQLCNSFEQRKGLPTPSSFHNKKMSIYTIVFPQQENEYLHHRLSTTRKGVPTPSSFHNKKTSTYTIVFPQQENEYLHHRLSTTRKDPINLKWIPPSRILRESVKRENNLHHKNF